MCIFGIFHFRVGFLGRKQNLRNFSLLEFAPSKVKAYGKLRIYVTGQIQACHPDVGLREELRAPRNTRSLIRVRFWPLIFFFGFAMFEFFPENQNYISKRESSYKL